MGLDGVELIMEFEDEFDLRIPDQTASAMFTVDDTVQYLKAELEKRGTCGPANATARAFYKLRNELMIRYGVSRNAVRLDVTIGELVPPQARRDWPNIAKITGLRPEPRWWFRARFPEPKTSVRTLIRSRFKQTWRRIDGSIDEGAIFERVQLIVAEQMDLPKSSIKRESRYIEDIGVG